MERKFFLAKPLAEVYIGRANTCIMTMKKALSLLLFASALCVSPLRAADDWAAEATNVFVNLVEAGMTPQIEVLPLNLGGGKSRDGMKTPLSSAPGGSWYVVNIPIEIKAVGRKENEKSGKSEKCAARFVDELTIKAYVLFEKRAKKKEAGIQPKDYFLLEKEVTYVDIPMNRLAEKGDGFEDPKGGAGYAKMSVGLYISPLSAMKLTGVPEKPDEAVRVVACAIESSFKGTACPVIPSKNAKRTITSFVADKKLKNFFSSTSQWWKGKTASHFDKTSAQLLTVAETPFATSYAPSYPAVKPMYGGGSSASSTGASATGDAEGSGSASSTTTTGADE